MSVGKIISGVICAAIFVAAANLSVKLFGDEFVYWQRGEEVQALITEKEIHLSSRSGTARAGGGRSGGGQARGYWLHYTFALDGQQYETRDMLDVGRGWDDVEEGDRIAVIYDPQDPSRNRAALATPVLRYAGILIMIWGMAGLFAFVPIGVLRD